MQSMKLDGAWICRNAPKRAMQDGEPITGRVPASQVRSVEQCESICQAPVHVIDIREQYPLFPELVIQS